MHRTCFFLGDVEFVLAKILGMSSHCRLSHSSAAATILPQAAAMIESLCGIMPQWADDLAHVLREKPAAQQHHHQGQLHPVKAKLLKCSTIANVSHIFTYFPSLTYLMWISSAYFHTCKVLQIIKLYKLYQLPNYMSKIRAVEQIIEITKCYKIPNHQITQITKLPHCQIICWRLEKFHVYVFLMMCCSEGIRISSRKKLSGPLYPQASDPICTCHTLLHTHLEVWHRQHHPFWTWHTRHDRFWNGRSSTQLSRGFQQHQSSCGASYGQCQSPLP